MRCKLHTTGTIGYGVARPRRRCDPCTVARDVQREGLRLAVRRVTTVDDAEFKPHSPARLWLDAKPRSDKFRQLANLGKFEAHLPFGPLRAFHHLPAPDVDADVAEPEGIFMQAWEDYGTVISDIEAALVDIKGLDEEEAAKHTQDVRTARNSAWLMQLQLRPMPMAARQTLSLGHGGSRTGG